jgi:hypothetical protein
MTTAMISMGPSVAVRNTAKAAGEDAGKASIRERIRFAIRVVSFGRCHRRDVDGDDPKCAGRAFLLNPEAGSIT